MNEIERAIKAFGIALEHPIAEHLSTNAYAIVEPAALTALAALREKAERSRGCPHCNDTQQLPAEGDPHEFYVRGNVLWHYDTVLGWEGQVIAACPHCGRRLEVKQDGTKTHPRTGAGNS